MTSFRRSVETFTITFRIYNDNNQMEIIERSAILRSPRHVSQ